MSLKRKIKILHVFGYIPNYILPIYENLKKYLTKFEFNYLSANDKLEFLETYKEYDLIHFWDWWTAADWNLKHDIPMDIINVDDDSMWNGDAGGDIKLKNIVDKPLRVVAGTKELSSKIYLTYDVYNHQCIEKTSPKNYSNPKVYEAWENLYTNIIMEKDKESIVKENFDKDYENLVISFGGLGDRFNFWNIFKKVPVKKIFVKDPNLSWYQKGINNELNTIGKSIQKLKELIKESKAKKIIVVGDSAGGTGAILFSHYINADIVMTFNAQTFATKELRERYNDDRWKKTADKFLEENDGFDLRYHLKIHNKKTKYYLFYSYYHGLDRVHNERLMNLQGINLIPLNSNYHGAAGELKNLGYLYKLIDEVCVKNKYDLINEIKNLWKNQ